MTYIKVLLGESKISALSPGKNQHLSCWSVTEQDTLPAAGLTSDLPVVVGKSVALWLQMRNMARAMALRSISRSSSLVPRGSILLTFGYYGFH